MQPFATERCYDRLHQSGWSVGEVSIATETLVGTAAHWRLSGYLLPRG